ncbi:MAG: hypothetical protein ACI8S6_000307 [Myxococcota bacterium]|jgi:hypothetical protein
MGARSWLLANVVIAAFGAVSAPELRAAAASWQLQSAVACAEVRQEARGWRGRAVMTASRRSTECLQLELLVEDCRSRHRALCPATPSPRPSGLRR